MDTTVTRRCSKNTYSAQHSCHTQPHKRIACTMLESGSGSGIRDQVQGYHNKHQAAISHGRIRCSTRRQQSNTEEHERIRRITGGVNNKK